MVDLTPREHHVLEALKLGLPNKLIAVRLNLSENTVKMHIQHIMRKCLRAQPHRSGALLEQADKRSCAALAITVILRAVCARAAV